MGKGSHTVTDNTGSRVRTDQTTFVTKTKMAPFFAHAERALAPRSRTLTPTIWWVFLASLWLSQLCEGQPPGVPPRPTLPPESTDLGDPEEPEYHDFDFDGLPGVQFELKVTIPPRRQECFFQKIKEGAQVHVIFEGLKGADRKVELSVVRPDGVIQAEHPWDSRGAIETKVEMEGDYGFCLGNRRSSVTHKLVYMFIASYLHRDWKEYAKDIEDFEVSVRNFSSALQSVDKAVQGAMRHLVSSRQQHMTDWYTISSNQSHIQNWSLVMCLVIVATSGLQAFFVRRLFRTTNVTPTSKPRA